MVTCNLHFQRLVHNGAVGAFDGNPLIKGIANFYRRSMQVSIGLVH